MRQYRRNPHQRESENKTAIPGKWAGALLTLALLAPLPARAVADSTTTVAGTPCAVGNETLAYDAGLKKFTFSGQISCMNAVPVGTMKLNMKGQFQDGSPRWSQYSQCSGCLSLLVSGAAGKDKFPDGINSLRAEGKVQVNATAHEVFALHDACYLIQGTTVTLLMHGCVGTATQK